MDMEMFKALRFAGVSSDAATDAARAIDQMIEIETASRLRGAVQPVLIAIGRLDTRMDGFDRRIDTFEKNVLRSEATTRWMFGIILGIPARLATIFGLTKVVGIAP